ncbi:pentatricopeptide repeat-containing At1g07740, mitochondrial [Olea europaea subsp. europaea]|uniref:Pentatricopeptide repeat-containing At1g07740, mitochondrial n=1 Tax=Olea europaea subsp. europaea TaxID=158383 RepID=A0A8S0SHB1_OLEEU|nr:pentatricopeptide repeat-containing At1g07740, mitochondrial [Olea europaea subsp. europaea]
MIYSRFKPVGTKIQSSIEFHYVTLLNSKHSQSYRSHGFLHNKPRKKPIRERPHKPSRNQLRTPIPFLNDLKQCENPARALSLFHRYYEMGIKHDYPSYASLVYKLARAKNFEGVDALLDLIRKYDIKCQEAVFIALIQHFGKAELIDKAVELFRDMGRLYNCVRTVKSFNTILNVLVDNDRVIDATELFRDGHKLGFRLNSVSFNIMIKMWLEEGEWVKSRQVFDEMLEREVEPTAVTYNCQIGFLCKRGNIDKAKSFFEDMVRKEKKPNAVTYALLMEGLCSVGKYNSAKKLMFDMEYRGCKAQLVNYGVLMSDLARRGLIDEARGLLVEMKKRRVKPDVVMYNILINYLCKEGKAAEGYKVLVDMQVGGCEPNAATYRMVVDGFCRIGDFEGGLKVLNVMLNSKHFPRMETFCSLVIGLVKGGKMDDVCFVLEEMERRNMRLDLDSWEILVKSFCKDHEVVARLLIDITSTGDVFLA